jgi:hypothetical protein
MQHVYTIVVWLLMKELAMKYCANNLWFYLLPFETINTEKNGPWTEIEKSLITYIMMVMTNNIKRECEDAFTINIVNSVETETEF